MIRAADLLWSHENAKARAAFVEAFDLATQDHKEKGDGMRREGVGLVSQVPDQRYAVIAAIGKLDLAWARKLSAQMLDNEAREAKEEESSEPEGSRGANEKLLTIALGLLPDQGRALNFARSSLRYSASFFLPIFLFKLAGVSNALADQFYEEALAGEGVTAFWIRHRPISGAWCKKHKAHQNKPAMKITNSSLMVASILANSKVTDMPSSDMSLDLSVGY